MSMMATSEERKKERVSEKNTREYKKEKRIRIRGKIRKRIGSKIIVDGIFKAAIRGSFK